MNDMRDDDTRDDHTQDLVAALFRTRDPVRFLNQVSQATRAISGADGATFVLREDDYCHYIEENAIAPLWKGKRFHMRVCVSGWAMTHKMSAVINDIYLDTRVPLEAYKPTFVQSMAMIPVNTNSPIAAIGSYWGRKAKPDTDVVQRLEALARNVADALAHAPLLEGIRLRAQTN